MAGRPRSDPDDPRAPGGADDGPLDHDPRQDDPDRVADQHPVVDRPGGYAFLARHGAPTSAPGAAVDGNAPAVRDVPPPPSGEQGRWQGERAAVPARPDAGALPPADREEPVLNAGDEIARRSWGQRVVVTAGVLVVMACLALVGFVGYQGVRLNGIARKDVDVTQAGDNEPQNWLVVGSDSRDVIARNDPNSAAFTAGGENSIGQRSDTIMVVRVDPAGSVTILSLQRDLWMPIARTGKEERINTAYGYDDGPQRLIDTIKEDFDIEINHYVEINFESFRGIVDAVGGVPMYFDKPMRDKNSGLLIDNPGCVVLSGEQALAFARSRHLEYKSGRLWTEDPSADLGRISRQQYFMRRMFDAAAKQVKNPKTMSDLIGVANQYIGLDAQIDVGKAADMVRRFGNVSGDAIKSFSLPVKPDMTPQGASVLMLEKDAARPILNRFRGLAEGDVDPASVVFSIENGSGTNDQAAQVRQAFEAIGYRPASTKDHGSTVARTTVRYAAGSIALADQLARHLTAGADLQLDPALATGTLALVTGTDFTTVMKRPRDPQPLPAEPGTTTAPTTTSAGPAAGGNGKTTTTFATATTTTTIPLNNTEASQVGIVPGQAPAGVACP